MNNDIFGAPLRCVRSVVNKLKNPFAQMEFIFTAEELAEHLADVHQIGTLQEKARCLNVMFETINKLYDCDSIDSNERIWFDANQLLDILEQAHREIAEGEK